MTYDKQDLLLDLRKLTARADDPAERFETHVEADEALLKFIDDEQITAVYEAIPRWYA